MAAPTGDPVASSSSLSRRREIAVFRPTRRPSSTSGPAALAVLGLVLWVAGPGGALAARPTASAAAAPGVAAALGRSIGLDSGAHPERAAAAVPTAFNPANVALALTPVASGFNRPVLVTHAGDGSGRLFVVEQTGRIRIIKAGVTLATPFLDVSHRVSHGSEQGLLGLAFHPSYPAAPYIYVNFTDTRGYTIINRYTVSANPDVINPASGVRIMTISQPFSNHNGGNLVFGPDGFLYIGMGDGGGAGDPGNRAQSTSTLLGKILRIGINRTSGLGNYAVPASNPYVGKAGLDQIWARGLRNPWRFSFDRLTGQLWIGDVGQSRYEEVDRSSPAGGFPAGRGANFGWSVDGGPGLLQALDGLLDGGQAAAGGGLRPCRERRRQLLGHRWIRLPRVGLAGARRRLCLRRLLLGSDLDDADLRPEPDEADPAPRRHGRAAALDQLVRRGRGRRDVRVRPRRGRLPAHGHPEGLTADDRARWMSRVGGQFAARNSRQAAATSAGSSKSSTAHWATSVAARSVVASAGGVAAASRNAVEWPAVPSGAIASSGWIVGQTQLTLPMSVLPEFGSGALVDDPVGGHVGPDPRAWSVVVPLHRRRAAARTSPRRSCRWRAPRPRRARRNRVRIPS